MNTTIAAMEKDLDFGNGSVRRWDTSSPSCDKLLKVANFLNVSTDYLLGRTEKDETEALINAYEKASPEIRSAVNVLLGLSEEAPKHADYRLAAYGGKGVIKDVPTKPKIT